MPPEQIARNAHFFSQRYFLLAGPTPPPYYWGRCTVNEKKRNPRMSQIPYPHLEESLGFLVNRAARAMAQSLRREMLADGRDITAEQWALLCLLWRSDGLTQQEIADASFKDKASITRIVNGMEKRHLIVRIHDRDDRRSNRIFLTRDGRELRDVLVPIADVVLRQATRGFSDREVAILKKQLDRIYANLGDLADDNR